MAELGSYGSAGGYRGLSRAPVRGRVSLRSIVLLDVTNICHCRNLCAIHAKRVTIMTRDLQLARRIRGPWGGLG